MLVDLIRIKTIERERGNEKCMWNLTVKLHKSTTKEEGIEMFVLSVHTYSSYERKLCAGVIL